MALKGDRLRSLREAKGYTQEELAELVDAGTLQIWRWESEKTDPASDFIEKLARVLGTSADYLIGLEDDPIDRTRQRDLSDDEAKLIEAYRTGRIWEIVKLLEKIAPTVVTSE